MFLGVAPLIPSLFVSQDRGDISRHVAARLDTLRVRALPPFGEMSFPVRIPHCTTDLVPVASTWRLLLPVLSRHGLCYLQLPPMPPTPPLLEASTPSGLAKVSRVPPMACSM